MTRQDVEKSPGEMLAQAREALGLSLHEAAAMTRISATMLSHLEEERYDEYTADVFVRGHLRSYARELKLDPDRVVRAYDRQTGRNTTPNAGDSSLQTTDKANTAGGVAGFGSRLSRLKRKVRASHVVAVGLVLVFLFVVVHLVGGTRATAKDPDRFESNSEEHWEVEEAAEETRWALERPGGESDDDEKGEESE
ncbi:MAG: helix-turn-helix domain-containing protein [Persicimonas sp.]